MALKITLKPQEKMIIGGAVLTNGSRSNCDLVIENKTPVLRQNDIMSEADADTPCRRLYFVIQLMYIDEENISKYTDQYWNFVQDIVQAAPSMTPIIDGISEHILQQKYYQALKLAHKLIDYEQEVINRVNESYASV
ncbi:MAG: flagellar biosynthesis repressor FlbT [Desulfobacterales bacterium]|jgi:flagellar protein FlbT